MKYTQLAIVTSFISMAYGHLSFAAPGGLRFVSIPPGEFLMGSPTDEISDSHLSDTYRRNRKEYQRTVILTRGFKMATTEVTQGYWHAVMGNIIGSLIPYDNSNLPVYHLTWEQAAEFINRINGYETGNLATCGNQLTEEGRVLARVTEGCYRMPTEAEWEYAARAGTTTPFNTGAVFSGDVVNCGTSSKSRYIDKPVTGDRPLVVSGSLPNANAWGLFDMHGNVSEMIADYYNSRWGMEDPATDPTGAPEPTSWNTVDGVTAGSHVLRGGSNDSEAYECRSAARSSTSPNHPSFKGGIRLVQTCATSGCTN